MPELMGNILFICEQIPTGAQLGFFWDDSVEFEIDGDSDAKPWHCGHRFMAWMLWIPTGYAIKFVPEDESVDCCEKSDLKQSEKLRK